MGATQSSCIEHLIATSRRPLDGTVERLPGARLPDAQVLRHSGRRTPAPRDATAGCCPAQSAACISYIRNVQLTPGAIRIASATSNSASIACKSLPRPAIRRRLPTSHRRDLHGRLCNHSTRLNRATDRLAEVSSRLIDSSSAFASSSSGLAVPSSHLSEPPSGLGKLSTRLIDQSGHVFVQWSRLIVPSTRFIKHSSRVIGPLSHRCDSLTHLCDPLTHLCDPLTHLCDPLTHLCDPLTHLCNRWTHLSVTPSPLVVHSGPSTLR